jgi:hypothetical protein
MNKIKFWSILFTLLLSFSTEVKANYSGIVWQEKSYAGRGNSNEPLLKLQFTYVSGENPTINFTPYFNNGDITAIKVYARAFPSSNSDDTDNVFYLNYNNNEYDLAIFDYRDPVNAPHQRVVYCGKTDTPVSGTELTYTVNTDKFGSSLGLSSGDKYFVYVTADISSSATEFDNTDTFVPNYIGATINAVTDVNSTTTYNVSVSTSYPAYENVGYPTAITATTDTQYMWTRRILKERHLVFAPYDGYSFFYRIPGLSDASDGSLLLTADARKRHNHDARNDFDILCKTSRDNGHTWSEQSIIAQGSGLALDEENTSTNNCQSAEVYGYGDCAIAQTGTARHMVAAFIAGAGLSGDAIDTSVDYAPNICYVTSQNAGETWSEVKKIDPSLITSNTSATEKEGVRSCPGPGRMLYVTSGPLKGKALLVVYTRLWNNLSTQYDWDILAYDETTDSWSNVGNLGKAITETTTTTNPSTPNNGFRAPGGGGSGGNNNGGNNNGGNQGTTTTTTTIATAMADYPGESQLVQLSDSVFIMTSRDDKASTYRHWYKLTLNSNGKFENSTGTRVDLTENENKFTEGAGACNSNFFIYELNGKKYLVQAMPTQLIARINTGTNTRSHAYLKYCDLTNIISGSSTQLNWENTGLDLSLGQATSGYTCVSPQSDGSIGIAVEEYPVAYQTPSADNCNSSRLGPDVLLSMWYMSTTIDNLSEGKLVGPVENRSLVPPTTLPSTCSIVKVNESDANSELQFDYNGGSSLDNVDIVINNADKIEYTSTDQGYAIVYSVDYIPVSTKTTTNLLSDVQGALNTSKISFDLKALLAKNNITIEKNDQIIVTAKTVIIGEAGGIVDESSVMATATYTYRTPTRSVVIYKMPKGANGKAYLESLSYDNEGQVRYFELGSTIDIYSTVNDKGTTFLGFSTSATNPDFNTVKLDDIFLKSSQPASSRQRHVYIPTLEEYPGDIVIYAWFKEREGGIHVGGHLALTTSKTLNAVESTDLAIADGDEIDSFNEQVQQERDVVFCSTDNNDYLTADISSTVFDVESEENFSSIAHSTVFANGNAGTDDHILLPPSSKYSGSQLRLTLTPDNYSYKRSAIVACWYRNATNTTSMASASQEPFSLLANTEAATENPGIVYRYVQGKTQSEITDNVASDLSFVTTSSATEGTDALSWYSGTSPESVTLDFRLPHIESTKGYYGKTFGYVVVYLVDGISTSEEITTFLQKDLEYVNDLTNYQSALLNAVPNYSTIESSLAEKEDEETANSSSAQQVRRKAVAKAQSVVENAYDSYLNRILIPIELEVDNTLVTGVENVTADSFTVVGLQGQATFTGHGNITVHNLLGQPVASFVLDGTHNIYLSNGIYIANGKKFIVK